MVDETVVRSRADHTRRNRFAVRRPSDRPAEGKIEMRNVSGKCVLVLSVLCFGVGVGELPAAFAQEEMRRLVPVKAPVWQTKAAQEKYGAIRAALPAETKRAVRALLPSLSRTLVADLETEKPVEDVLRSLQTAIQSKFPKLTQGQRDTMALYSLYELSSPQSEYLPSLAARKDLDNMSEMGEMESLKLQMIMDRKSKVMETLSNMLKKLSDTSSAITGNIK